MCAEESKILEAMCSIKEGNKFERVCANLFLVLVHVSMETVSAASSTAAGGKRVQRRQGECGRWTRMEKATGPSWPLCGCSFQA